MKKIFVICFLFGAVFFGFSFTAPLSAAEEKKSEPTLKQVAPTPWEEANNLYRLKDYRNAIKLYKGLLEKNSKDPSVYFNLGNSYFRLGELGRAVYYYEKAHSLDPRSTDIRKNLGFAFAQIKVKTKETRPAVLLMVDAYLDYVRRSELLTLTLVLYVLYLFLAVWSFLISDKKFLRRTRRLIFLLFLISLSAFAWKWFVEFKPSAVILEPQVEMKYGPAREEKSLFRLPEGVKVKVAEVSAGWYRIQLPGGETGWVEGKALGIL